MEVRLSDIPRSPARRDLQFAVIVAMVAMRVVEMTIHEVVDMVPVRDGFVAAIRPMNVRVFMPGAIVTGRAFLGIRGGHFDPVIVYVVAVVVM